MWTISCSQLLGDVCSSKSLLVEIEKKKNSRTPHRHTSTHTHSHTRTRHTQAHTPCTHPCTATHYTHAHTPCTCTHCTHATRHAHMPCTGTHCTHAHAQQCTNHAQQTLHKGKKLRQKRAIHSNYHFFEVGVAISAKHISSAPKGESSSTVELQIGGAVAPELVWWSRSPPKHALILSKT
jgi:hypothetical protein